MTRAKRLLFEHQQAQSPHTELSYLQSSGTQYINTGILGQSGLKVEISCGGFTNFLFGSRVAFQNGAYYIYMSRFDYYTTAYNITWDNNISHLYVIDNNLFYVDGALKATGSTTQFNNSLNNYLFGCSTNGAFSSGSAKIYYCKIWNASGVLVRNLIPVIKTDGTYCMYDKTNSIYYPNVGTGVFIGG